MKLALGTVQFGLSYGISNDAGQVTRPEAKAMLHLAEAIGIDTLDTAITYGESESCLGKIGVQSFKLVTKLPVVPESCADIGHWVQAQISASLGRLGVNELYGLLLHRSEQLLGPVGKELYRALQDSKDRGQIQKLGVSIYSPSELEAITKTFRIDLVQVPFNLIDRRLQTTGWLQRLKDAEVEIHTRSTFLQGLLLMPRQAIPPKFWQWSNLFERWHAWLADHQASAIQACIAFPLTFPEIDRVVVGAVSVVQLEQIVCAAKHSPPDSFPDLQCDAEELINPSRWSSL
jgi:aryl-alcohol dehydrogenase-like predicted oxidoreductase